MKRCKYCGSTLIHPDTRHKTFSTGKAVAGAVTFGVVGAAAGFIGKDKNGYSCGACGAFMDAPMEFSTELGIDSAIRDARAGRNYSTYEYFKSQYPNIENVPAPVQAQIPQAQPAALLSLAPVPALPAAPEAAGPAVKNRYRYLLWQPDCPVYVEEVIVKAGPQGDLLSLVACNQSSQPIRSAYFNVVCYDDTGDVASTVTCVYQGLSIEPGAALPAEKEFSLNTEVAYRIDLVCDKVALTDGSVWRNSEDSPKITLPVQEELTSENFPRFRYLRSELSDVCRTVPERLYFPAESEDVRLCICGHPTLPGTPCRFCGLGEDALKDLLSQKRLAELQQKSVKEIAESRAAKSIPLYAAAADEAYAKAEELLNADAPDTKSKLDNVQKASLLFARIAGWKDADDRYSTCGQEIEKLQAQIEEERIAAEKKAEEERIAREEREAREKKEAEERAERERIEAEERRAKNIKMAKIFGPIAAAAVIFLILLTKVILPSSNYKKAAEAMAAEDYKTAVTLYTKLGSYKDSAELLPQAQIGSDYDDAKALLDEGKYQEAIAAFQAVIKSYDALQKGSKPDSGKEEPATMRPAEDTPETPSQKPADTPANVDPAKETIVEDSYKNSRSLLREAQNGLAYEKALDKLNNKRYDDAIKAFTDLGSYKDSPDQLKESYYCKALSLLDKGKNEEAEEILLALGDYKDALDKAGGSTYQRAQKLMSEEQYAEAAALFTKLGDYKDSADQAKECSYQAAVASLVPITDYLKNGPSPEEIAIAAAAGIPLDEKAFTEESYYALMAELRETFLSLGSYKDSAKYAAHFFRRVIAVDMKSFGNTNYRHYDLSGRISTDEYSFRYIYNTSGKLDSVGLTKLTYNEAGQFVSISGLNVTLNDAGLPAAYDAPAQYNKVSYRFTYDSQGRLIERTRNSGTDNAYTKENITVTYDASGDITEIKQVTENKNYSGVRTSEAIRVPVYGYIYCSAADEAPDTAVDPLLYHQ